MFIPAVFQKYSQIFAVDFVSRRLPADKPPSAAYLTSRAAHRGLLPAAFLLHSFVSVQNCLLVGIVLET